MKRFLFRTVLPWTITVLAIYFAARDIRWDLFVERMSLANWRWIVATIGIMSVSYLLRARRWQTLLPISALNYSRSLRVLLLGFFMNNVLPARMGEIVRAAVGGQVTKASRAMVLGSIASERLIDGLTLSAFLLAILSHLASGSNSTGLQSVAGGFALGGVSILVLITLRKRLGTLGDSVANRLPGNLPRLLLAKCRVFFRGLVPLTAWPGCLIIVGWSLLIWLIELSTFFAIGKAFAINLSLDYAILFLIAINFSSLIPAAPGGIGVIEAAATAVLVSAGFERELALSMVIVQHIIQFTIILCGGSLSLLSLQRQFSISRTSLVSSENSLPQRV